jgi:hypothetical protein
MTASIFSDLCMTVIMGQGTSKLELFGGVSEGPRWIAHPNAVLRTRR